MTHCPKLFLMRVLRLLKCLRLFFRFSLNSSPTQHCLCPLSCLWLDLEYLIYHQVNYRNLHPNKPLAFLALRFLGRKFQIPTSWSFSPLCLLSSVCAYGCFIPFYTQLKRIKPNIRFCLRANPFDLASSSPQKSSFILIKLISVWSSLHIKPHFLNFFSNKRYKSWFTDIPVSSFLSSNPHTKRHLIFSYLF